MVIKDLRWCEPKGQKIQGRKFVPRDENRAIDKHENLYWREREKERGRVKGGSLPFLSFPGWLVTTDDIAIAAANSTVGNDK
jgi:hypothetical protein